MSDVVVPDEVLDPDARMDSPYTEICPECGHEVAHAQRNTAKMMLGKHRRSAHGVEGQWSRSGKAGRRRSGRPPVRDEQSVPVRVLKTAAEEIPDRKTAPSVADLNKALARGFGTLSVLAASYAAETDRTITTEVDRDAVVDYLSLSPEAANEVAYPFAKAFGKSRLNKKYGRAIVDNIDLVSAGAELVNLGIRWRRYLNERERRTRVLDNAPPPSATNGNVAGPVVPPTTFYPPPGSGEFATGGASQPPMTGHVVSGAEVQRMRGQHIRRQE